MKQQTRDTPTSVDNNKSKLIDRFEKEHGYWFEKNEKALKEIKVNRRAVSGYLPNAEKKVKANLILATLQALLPHLFAKAPEVAINPSEKVNPVDGDPGQDVYEQANRFSETARILLKRVMLRAGLKKKARKAVRAAATAKHGIIKVSYRKDFYEDHLVRSELQTQQAQLAKLSAMAKDIKEGTEEHRKMEQAISQGSYDFNEEFEKSDQVQRIVETIKSLEQGVRKVRKQGIHLSVIPLDQMRWDVSVSAEDVREGSYISHFIYDTIENTKARFDIGSDKESEERVKKWKKFDSNEVATENVTLEEGKGLKYVKIWERWDAETSSVYTWVEGDKRLAREPKHPQMYEDMWYPFFVLGLNELDGEDLGLSVVETLIPLMEQYERTTDDKEEHRQAAIPFMMYDQGRADAKNLKYSLSKVGARDLIGINANGNDLKSLFAPGPSVPLNERLYDTQSILFEMQNVSGVGDAERGGIARAKTLGEAQIVQQGLATRTEDARDAVETWLGEIFKYSLAVLLQKMPTEEVIAIAGPNAYWPSLDQTAESFFSLVDVDIEAGSSGRPDKRSDQEVWFSNLELMNVSVQQVMQMRQQGIADDQNPVYRLLEESIRRLDERLDISTLLPDGEIITNVQLIQSLQQQLQSLGDPALAQMGASLLQQNPLVNQIIQGQQNEIQQ